MSSAVIADIAKAFIEDVWNLPGGSARVGEWLSDDYRDHAYASDREGLSRAIDELRSAFSDARFVIEDVLATTTSAVLRLKLVGTQSGDFRGRPARGASVEVTVFRWLRFEGRRIAEHWALLDTTSLMKQLEA